jgi:hypothetical protein
VSLAVLAMPTPFCQLDAGALDLVGLGSRPAEAAAHHASLGGELTLALDRGLDGLQPGPHPLPDHAALELGEGTCHLEQELAHRRGGADVLLIEVEVDTGGLTRPSHSSNFGRCSVRNSGMAAQTLLLEEEAQVGERP